MNPRRGEAVILMEEVQNNEKKNHAPRRVSNARGPRPNVCKSGKTTAAAPALLYF